MRLRMPNTRQFTRRLGGIAVAALLCSVGLLATAGSASAAGGDWLYTEGGRGYASWTWSTSNYANITNLTKVAWDTDCDDDGVYTYIEIYQGSYRYQGSAVHDSCSGGQTSTTGGSFNGNMNITGIRVFVCEDVDWSDDCSSQYYDSPYT